MSQCHIRFLILASALTLSGAASAQTLQWYPRASGVTKTLNGICRSQGLYVAAGRDGYGNCLLHSADGVAWTASTPTFLTKELFGVAAGNDAFVLVEFDGAWRSDNGISWTASAGAPDVPTSIRFADGRFFALGVRAHISTSSNGLAWTPMLAGGDNNDANDVATANNVYVAGGQKNNGLVYLALSLDSGNAWTEINCAVTNAIRSLAWGNGRFVAVGGIGYEHGLIMVSSDGQTWTTLTQTNEFMLNKVIYESGLFVAVGDAGTILVSSDGVNWMLQHPPTGNSLYDVTFAQDRFMAVGGKGVILQSAPLTRPRSSSAARDYDGDGRSDFAVFDPSAACWYVLSADQETVLAWQLPWGMAGARPLSGDYDGDGRSDFAVFDPSAACWYVLSADQETVLAWQLPWGMAGARPLSGDYDGDGRDDFALFDPSAACWYVLSANQETVLAWQLPWGMAGARPLSGDYDGDGRDDFALFDPSAACWYVLSADQETALAWQLPWGMAGARPLSGDYDGDGRSDFAVFDPAAACWYVLSANQETVPAWQLPWGMQGAWPVGVP